MASMMVAHAGYERMGCFLMRKDPMPHVAGVEIPRLTHEEEIEYARRFREEEDEQAWGKLYCSYLLALRGRLLGLTKSEYLAEDIADMAMERAKGRVLRAEWDTRYRFYTLLCYLCSSILAEQRRKRPWTVTESDLPVAGDDSPSIENLPESMRNQSPQVIDMIEQQERRIQLLRIIFHCCAKPHQIITTGFVNLLDWKPAEIVEQLVPRKKLGELGDHLWPEYYLKLDPAMGKEEFLQDVCGSFYEKQDRMIGEVYREPEYERLRDHERSKVAEVAYSIFFPAPEPKDVETKKSQKNAAAISNWCMNVKLRARYLVEHGKICRDGQTVTTA